jgi:hypothetical protein
MFISYFNKNVYHWFQSYKTIFFQKFAKFNNQNDEEIHELDASSNESPVFLKLNSKFFAQPPPGTPVKPKVNLIHVKHQKKFNNLKTHYSYL